jgi:outer membrane receptor for Fe3+-dicitrate
MAQKKQVAAEPSSTETLPHLITVVGHGVPKSFELTVDGTIAAIGSESADLGSNNALEGTLASGTAQFRFSGEMVNAHFLEGDATEQDDSSSAPTVHVEYGKR